ncbi:methyltransferase domain-containing protein [Hazenella sp. IB182353]|uniref:methyltransferase domain-containing protein n=1 Tax=Polycladospora coralii TaxID=2771432 RepID=UPI00174706D9|nr:methyltransferase domain-containing protein [Polycladospora coralii]MBS7530507.1 methyltransferase domain-containing protein [Polycladospora coralii]
MYIKELAQRLGVTTRTIRFYEEKGLIKPRKNAENQYRTFSEQDAWRIQTILCLREVDMPIHEIKSALSYLDQGDHEEVIYYLQLQRAAMFADMTRIKDRLSTLDQMITEYHSEPVATWEKLWALTEKSKLKQEKRNAWVDRWHFDRQANQYDIQVQSESAGFHVHQDYDQALDQIACSIQPLADEIGLDIGIGTGNLTLRLISSDCEMKGVDQSVEMLKICKEKLPDIETRIGNFLAIPYPDQSFDFIVTSYALHHLTDEQKLLALTEMKRVLKPTGRIGILDLMFTDEAERIAYLEGWKQKERFDVISTIEDEYYADKSRLVSWLDEHGYQVDTEKINDILHCITAVRLD